MLRTGHRPRPRLRAKLISWSFIPTAIVLVAVAGVILYAFQRATADLVIERDRELTRLMARQVSLEIEPYERTLAEVAAQLAPAKDAGERCALLHDQTARLGFFDGGVALLDANGVVLTMTPMDVRQMRREWGQHGGISRTLSTGIASFTSVGPFGLQEDDSVGMVMPLRSEEGEVVGALVGIFALRDGTLSGVYRQAEQQVASRLGKDPLYWQSGSSSEQGGASGLIVLLQRAGLTRYSASSTASAYLVDRQGVVIHGAAGDLTGHRLPQNELQELIAVGQVGALRMRSDGGRQMVACYAPIGSTGWGLITCEDWGILYEPARRLSHYLVVLLALGVLVPGLVVTIAIRRITRPVDTLVAATRRVGAGDFVRVELDTRDELAELAKGFSQMSARLQALYADLEQRVADRTLELRTLLDVSQKVSSILSPPQVLETGLSALLTFVGAQQGLACAEGQGDGEQEDIIVSLGELPCATEVLCTLSDQAADGKGKPVVATLAGGTTMLVVPLQSPEGRLGRLMALLPPAFELPEPRLALVASIGQQVSVALGNALLFERASAVAAEAERQRLARDLHDSVAQAVYGVSLYARATNRLLASGQVEAAQRHLEVLQDSACQALAEMRLLIYQARGPACEPGRLAEAIQARLDHVEVRAGISVELKVAVESLIEPAVEEALFYVATEALNNVVRHANASSVRIRLASHDGRVALDVADDGQGFDPARVRAGGVGLGNIQTRIQELGGQVRITSAAGKGTVVSVEVLM